MLGCCFPPVARRDGEAQRNRAKPHRLANCFRGSSVVRPWFKVRLFPCSFPVSRANVGRQNLVVNLGSSPTYSPLFIPCYLRVYPYRNLTVVRGSFGRGEAAPTDGHK